MPVKYVKKTAKAKKPAAYRRKAAPMKKRMVRSVVKRSVVSPTTIKHTPGTQSNSLWVSSNKMSPTVKALQRVSMPVTRTENGEFLVTNSIGKYGLHSLQHCNNGDMGDLFGALPGTTTPQVPGSGPRRLVLESYTSNMTCVNTSTVDTQIELYDLVLRTDIPRVNVLDINGTAWTVPAALPEYYVMTGLAQTIGATGIGAPETFGVGLSIYDSKLFTDYFKVVKRTIVNLPPGASHNHTVKLNANKIIDENRYHGSTTLYASRGLGCYTMIMSRPSPTFWRSVTADPELAGVTIPTGTIRILQTRRYKFSWSNSVSTYRSFADELDPVIEGQTFALVNSVSGIPAVLASDQGVEIVP